MCCVAALLHTVCYLFVHVARALNMCRGLHVYKTLSCFLGYCISNEIVARIFLYQKTFVLHLWNFYVKG